jgi:hypothetical protein
MGYPFLIWLLTLSTLWCFVYSIFLIAASLSSLCFLWRWSTDNSVGFRSFRLLWTPAVILEAQESILDPYHWCRMRLWIRKPRYNQLRAGFYIDRCPAWSMQVHRFEFDNQSYVILSSVICEIIWRAYALMSSPSGQRNDSPCPSIYLCCRSTSRGHRRAFCAVLWENDSFMYPKANMADGLRDMFPPSTSAQFGRMNKKYHLNLLASY